MALGKRHTADTRAKIAAGQADRWARRHRSPEAAAAAYLAYRRAIMALEIGPGDTDILRLLYARALEVAPHKEQPRWRKRLAISDAGRRVAVKTCDVEVFAGDDLRDLERLRNAEFVDDLTT